MKTLEEIYHALIDFGDQKDKTIRELQDALGDLLNCTDLNVDELDETSIEAISKAKKALDKSRGE